MAAKTASPATPAGAHALNDRELLKVLIAFEKGDFSVRAPTDLTGMPGKIADTLNLILEHNEHIATELQRMQRMVGNEGRLSQRASMNGARGQWSATIHSINTLVDDLVRPINETSRVIGAVARGDLSQMMNMEVDGRELQGEFRRTAKIVNTMVDQLGSFASEVTRVAREVGTEGKLGGQAKVKGVAGTWKDLTDSVNTMAENLTGQVRNIAAVTTAVAKGDLSKKITVDVKGEILELKDTINTMVDQLGSFASEVTRVAREVGVEGKLGAQAEVKGVSGTWKDLTDSVNTMAENLTGQVRNIAAVTTAVARGDLSKKITVDVKGEILELKNTINTMVEQLRSFASEVTRVAREVGTEGKLGGQAKVAGVSGTWKDLTDNVNGLAANLTGQVRNIAEVTTAVARGDLSKKITVDVKGEILELKDTINTMVDQLSTFASEVTRVAREVGTEGKLGGQARVPGVSGTWKDLTDNVNGLAANLTGQVRNIAEVTTAVARGDLSKKITVDVKGEILELKDTINTMVDQLSTFASEVTRVAREVGTEGKLGGQARVQGVAGTWKDLTDNVNSMAGNLTSQVRNIADVTTAVANGDLSKKITVDVKGEILELKDTINTMVDQLRSFASEVTRVAREVGTEGKLGGQAYVTGVAGTWKDLTDNVNSMAGNLTSQVRNIADVTTAVANGDLSRKITVDVKGEILELKDTINTMVDQLSSFASEVTRVARDVGTEGKLGGQAYVPGVAGTWKDLTDNVNSMAGNLTSQVRNIADVTTAVANGDLSRKITVDVKGEILELKDTINTMVDQLSSFASEVTRVARDVGTEGKLGGQARVQGVAGTWKDLTDNVNSMAGNLTNQVRGIARVVSAVAQGDLKQELVLTARGEIAELGDTINAMIRTLATFADQVTSVAREVGVEGKLGGQALVPGASGTWKDLTDNVNQLAANLTTQVRAIAEVATAVTKGDLTRSIRVDARGEVASLKDNINQMILNLRETTQKNTEQDWLKTNLAKFTRMLQGQKDLMAVARLILSELAPVVSAQQGVFYVLEQDDDEDRPYLNLLASYAFRERKHLSNRFYLGEGLVGQSALEKQPILLRNVPGDYIRINSGLGDSPPLNIIVIPVLFEGQVKAVMELASFEPFNPMHHVFLEQLSDSIGIVLNTIEANMRTESLLEQSQSLAKELQHGQLELQKTNDELEEKARLLAEQNAEVEKKNREVQLAKEALEEKAEQLALTSKYKSEFLANMSHELRSPLNSLLILSRQLADNGSGNLDPKQVEFAETIHASGSDLLALINDILDLSKIESGIVSLELEDVNFRDIQHFVERNFRQIANMKKLLFAVELEPGLPEAVTTDEKRLFQVLKNLLSNAFKFTEQGGVELRIAPAREGWNPTQADLDPDQGVIAFSITDTGIGIAPDKQRVIFESFQQAEGSTNRKYGGTGLGLSISREISRLLGGDITLESELGQGSTFTFYLPVQFAEGRPGGREHRSASSAPGEGEPPADGDGAARRRQLEKVPLMVETSILDDRTRIQPGDRVMLIIEDDRQFAQTLLDIAHEQDFKALIATRGENVFGLVVNFTPDAVMLDIILPDIDGWKILGRLKNNPVTRHIPVLVVTIDDDRPRAFKRGAFDVLRKPVAREQIVRSVAKMRQFIERPVKRLLLVEDEEQEREQIRELIGNGDVKIEAIGSVEEALEFLRSESPDCMVLDLLLPGTSGFELVERIEQENLAPAMPIIVYTGKELTREEEQRLGRMVQTVIAKDVRSPERLVDEVSLFLHRRTDALPEEKQTIVKRIRESDEILRGRRVLVIDDDVRNIFALASVMEQHGIKAIPAESGREGLAVLRDGPPVDLVLIDIMMPEMDGYETIRRIRAETRFKSLPIVAVTAKAMKGDRENCIEAGASDYVPKPVDMDYLFSMLRELLCR
ncbi:MAG TPA: HAMP domain-containing protein [Candidatus Sumerlaeota bacterium]|nr:HAMP domain-containing protein [Candidatus Sumerlaeota bacterium]